MEGQEEREGCSWRSPRFWLSTCCSPPCDSDRHSPAPRREAPRARPSVRRPIPLTPILAAPRKPTQPATRLQPAGLQPKILTPSSPIWDPSRISAASGFPDSGFVRLGLDPHQAGIFQDVRSEEDVSVRGRERERVAEIGDVLVWVAWTAGGRTGENAVRRPWATRGLASALERGIGTSLFCA